MLLYLFDFRKVFFEGASKSSTALQCMTRGTEWNILVRHVEHTAGTQEIIVNNININTENKIYV